jgi:hypothetical protein
MTLVPCPSCSRHVRATESTCPFCATSLAIDPPAPAVIGERLGRAALFAFGAALATNAAACGTATVPPGDDAAVHGDAGPPADAGTDAFVPPSPDSGFFPPYGTPPPEDAGHDGGLAGAYGAPPPIDAGH